MTLPALAIDWTQFDPAEYLNDYYADVGPENLALLRFLAEAYEGVPRGSRLLDFGGGPTIYPLISAVGRVQEVHFSDYLDANLAEVKKWLANAPGAFGWDDFVRRAILIETGKECSDADVRRREEAIRALVTKLTRCDASRTPPLEGRYEPYDVVVTNFCAESATSDRWQWRTFVANIASLLVPGGVLIMSALKGATSYAVGRRSFPAVRISAEELAELLEETGFPEKGIEIRSVPADRTTRSYEGLLLAVARKNTNRSQGRP